jgi:regulatory protein
VNPPKSKKPESELSASARALRLVARRDYTRLELKKKLEPHVEDPAELEAVLDDFTERGWISEPRVLEQVVHAKSAGLGASRIRHALQKRGISDELIGPALVKLRESEPDRARSVLARKFKAAPATPPERARQVRFLQSRGFSFTIAMRAVSAAREEDGGDAATDGE